MLKNLILKNRSYRRFFEEAEIGYDVLENLVDLARNTASTANLQGLKYKIINTPEDNLRVFSTLGWAGRLNGKGTPPEGERPSAYIIILCDTRIAKELPIDCGIAAQTILLGAVEEGFGGCMLGSINREKLAVDFVIDLSDFTVPLVIALGKPKENVILTEVGPDGNIAYYRDEEGNHYVPKRKLEDIIIK